MLKLLSLILLFSALSLNAASLIVGVLFTSQVTGSSPSFGPNKSGRKTFQATVTGSGTVSSTVQILVTNDSSTPAVLLGTITLNGTNSATDGFATEGSWNYYMAKVTAIAGTNATVQVMSAAE